MAGKKRSTRPRRKAPRRKARRGVRDVPDRASLSVTRSMEATGPPGTQFSVNTLYSLMNTQLIDYPRAVTVASAYQHYRIKKITLRFKPSYDTFGALGIGAPANQSKPILYHMIDKSGSVPTNASLEALKNMGAKPKQFDEKDHVVSWRPSVLEAVMYASGGTGASSASKYQISPWLTTSAANVSPGAFSPSGIDHLGCYWYLNQLAGSASYQYSIECEVQFEFKKPLNNLLAASEAITARVATLNTSSDGVVGGGDGD